jgi:hypothetical protein
MAVGPPPPPNQRGIDLGKRLIAAAEQLENSAKILQAQANVAIHAALECRNAAGQVNE